MIEHPDRFLYYPRAADADVDIDFKMSHYRPPLELDNLRGAAYFDPSDPEGAEPPENSNFRF